MRMLNSRYIPCLWGVFTMELACATERRVEEEQLNTAQQVRSKKGGVLLANVSELHKKVGDTAEH